jgi:hypothetical protein
MRVALIICKQFKMKFIIIRIINYLLLIKSLGVVF